MSLEFWWVSITFANVAALCICYSSSVIFRKIKTLYPCGKRCWALLEATCLGYVAQLMALLLSYPFVDFALSCGPNEKQSSRSKTDTRLPDCIINTTSPCLLYTVVCNTSVLLLGHRLHVFWRWVHCLSVTDISCWLFLSSTNMQAWIKSNVWHLKHQICDVYFWDFDLTRVSNNYQTMIHRTML